MVRENDAIYRIITVINELCIYIMTGRFFVLSWGTFAGKNIRMPEIIKSFDPEIYLSEWQRC